MPYIAVEGPDGNLWFCESGAIAADGDIWFTENFANKIGRMNRNGALIGEYQIPTAASGARCITAMHDGRLFFTQYDVGLIGEIIPQRF